MVDTNLATSKALNRHLRQFHPRTVIPAFPSLGGGQGGAPTIGVAASNASAYSIGKAEIKCVGTDDQDQIMHAMLELYRVGGGRLWLSEGIFSVEPDVIVVGYSFAYPVPILMIGMGEATVLQVQGTASSFGIRVAPTCNIRDFQVSVASES